MYTSLSVSPGAFHGVRRINFDGTGPTNLITTWPSGSESPFGTFTGWFIDGLTLDLVNIPNQIYYGDVGVLIANGAPSGIVRTNLDGTLATSLVPHLDGRGRGLALDLAANKMYFAEHAPASTFGGRIWQANLDGTGLVVIVPGLQRPRDLALDLGGGKIYWVDESTKKIQNANLDGSGVADVVGLLDSPDSLALLFEPSAGGAFVIGDEANHAAGDRVNFWGAQWAKNNPVSGVAARGRNSFKGFANTPALPQCGDVWTSRPGNSSKPPTGPLSAAMRVIVTDRVTKKGPVLSGIVDKILVVKPEAGYGPNPGHRGFGEVLSVVCSQ